MNKFWTRLNVVALATILFCFASCQNNQNFSLKAHQAAKAAQATEATQAALADEEMNELVAKRDDGHHKKKKEKKKKRRKSRERKSK